MKAPQGFFWYSSFEVQVTMLFASFVGEVTFEVVKRTVRCAATTVDGQFGSGKYDHNVPALLKKHFPQHGAYLGVYARVVNGGRISLGDGVSVLKTDSNASLVPPSNKDSVAWIVTLGAMICIIAAVIAVRYR